MEIIFFLRQKLLVKNGRIRPTDTLVMPKYIKIASYATLADIGYIDKGEHWVLVSIRKYTENTHNIE